MVRFVDHFWGERNKGFDELILNFKKSYLSIEDFHKFLLESGNVELTYCRLLSRLSSYLTNKFTTTSSFYPIGDALRQFIEEIGSVHENVISAYQILIDEVAKYQQEQKQRQKQVKEEESKTAELITSLNTTYNSVIKARQNYHTQCAELKRLQSESTYLTNSNCRLMDKVERKVRVAGEEYRSLLRRYELIREQFETKFTDSCNKFQKVEEEHLARMKNFCIAYTDAALTCSENLRETRRKFIVKCDQLSIDNILLSFVHARKTGSDHPPKLEFEEFRESSGDAYRRDLNGMVSPECDNAHGENLPSPTADTNKGGNVGGSSGADPFFHAIFMGFWRSRDGQRSRRRRIKKQNTLTSTREIPQNQIAKMERPQTTDPSMDIRPGANIQKRYSTEWEDKSNFISSYTNIPERTTGSTQISESNLVETPYRWSSSSPSSSDGEDRQKLCIAIKPIQSDENKEESEWQKQNFEIIQKIFSENKPKMQRFRSRRAFEERSRCASAMVFQKEPSESAANLSKTAPSTPISEIASQDSRMSWLEGSQETLCPTKQNDDSGSIRTLVQSYGTTETPLANSENVTENTNKESTVPFEEDTESTAAHFDNSKESTASFKNNNESPYENDKEIASPCAANGGDDPWASFSFSRSMSTVSAAGSEANFSTCSSVASSPVPIIRRLSFNSTEVTSFSVALMEKAIEGSTLSGALVFAFPSSSISQLQPILFQLSGLENVSKIVINKSLVTLRKVEPSERHFDLRIDKLQTTLRARVSHNSRNFVNVNLIRYQFSPVNLSQWMFVDFHSNVNESLHRNEVQITPIERLTNFKITMILPCRSFSCRSDQIAKFKRIPAANENETIEWCPGDKDLTIGKTYKLVFETTNVFSLKSATASFLVDRIALSTWEANHPFGSIVRFALNEECKQDYHMSQLRYKVNVENIPLG